jgi:hypothetical protein
MATKRTKKRAVLTALPKRIEKVQADASKAINRGYKATLELLPPNSRKVVRDLGSQLDGAASELRTRGRKVLRGVERRGEQVAEQVEAAVAGAERRSERAVRNLERESAKWLEAFETSARKVLSAVTERLDIASAHDVAALSRRVANLERKIPARKRAA